MAFTGSVSPKILGTLESMFKGPTMVEAEFQHPYATIKEIAKRQSVEVEQNLKGNRCTGVSAWFINSGDVTNGYDGIVPDPTAPCDLPTGPELSTESEDYKNNIFIKRTRSINANKCDNELSFVREMAKTIQLLQTQAKVTLNKRGINLLDSNVQPNQDTNMPTYMTAVGATNRIGIPSAQMDYEQLAEIDNVMQINDIPEYFLISGRNFATDSTLAKYRDRASGVQDGGAAMYNDWDIHWDLRNLDVELGRKTTFAVNPNVLLFWNVHWSDLQGQVIDPSKNLSAFAMPDAEMTWTENGVTQRLWHEYEMSYGCIGRNTHTSQLQYGYNVTQRTIGGIYVAPAGYNKPVDPAAVAPAKVLTGIMAFDAV